MIRGRAVQTTMYEFRQRRQLLIDEIRSTHALIKEEQAEKRRQMLQIRTDQTRFENLIYEVDDWKHSNGPFLYDVFTFPLIIFLR